MDFSRGKPDVCTDEGLPDQPSTDLSDLSSPGLCSAPTAKQLRLEEVGGTTPIETPQGTPQSSEPATTPQTPADHVDQEEVRNRGKAKGQIRRNPVGDLEHYLESAMAWQPAVYHNDIRAELIEEASRQGEYDHPRERGLGDTDITSFIPSQKSWSAKQEHWPDVLFTLDIKKVPKNPNLPKKVPLWYRGEMVVLDQDNHPMRYFPDLPATCSSQTKEWLLVAICHLDFRITINDIRARMPNEFIEERTQRTAKLIGANALSMRMSSFRLQAGLMPRQPRVGSKPLEEELKKILGQQCVDENYTRPFGRLLTRDEIKEVQKPNKGKFGNKSRSKKGQTTEIAKKRKMDNNGHESDADDGLLHPLQEPTIYASRNKKPCYDNREAMANPLFEKARTHNSATGLRTRALSAPSYLGPQMGTPMDFVALDVLSTQLQRNSTRETFARFGTSQFQPGFGNPPNNLNEGNVHPAVRVTDLEDDREEAAEGEEDTGVVAGGGLHQQNSHIPGRNNYGAMPTLGSIGSESDTRPQDQSTYSTATGAHPAHPVVYKPQSPHRQGNNAAFSFHDHGTYNAAPWPEYTLHPPQTTSDSFFEDELLMWELSQDQAAHPDPTPPSAESDASPSALYDTILTPGSGHLEQGHMVPGTTFQAYTMNPIGEPDRTAPLPNDEPSAVISPEELAGSHEVPSALFEDLTNEELPGHGLEEHLEPEMDS